MPCCCGFWVYSFFHLIFDMNELERFRAALGEIVDPVCIDGWLEVQNAALGGKKPIEYVKSGDFKPLWEMIHRLQSGEPG